MNIAMLCPSFKWCKRLAILACALGVSLVGLCAFFRIHGPNDAVAFRYMATSGLPPVWKEFAFRRVGQGDSEAAFLQANPPSIRLDYGVYRHHLYFPGKGIGYIGCGVIAKDGRLLAAGAWACCWHFEFFTLPELDVAAFDEAWKKKVEQDEKEATNGTSNEH